MGSGMCKYRYRNGLCSHAAVGGIECVGEERCLDRHERKAHSSCSRDMSLGLYCSKYRRFYCAGIENCGTPEAYALAMQERMP
jgi:hypothetical protein